MSVKISIRLIILLLTFAMSAYVFGCKREAGSQTISPELSNPPGNLLANPGFEDGRKGWFWMDWSRHWMNFDISDSVAHSGKKSAWLKLDVTGPATREVEIHGVVQQLKPAQFPKAVRGWYRVENWRRGSSKQYLQFVTIVWGGHPTYKNYQIRYVLAGATTPVYRMRNAHYAFPPNVSMEPVQDKWIKFEVSILEEFKRAWGMIPTGYEKINFFFEARYDNAPKAGQKIRADVYYDDLYIGDGD